MSIFFETNAYKHSSGLTVLCVGEKKYFIEKEITEYTKTPKYHLNIKFKKYNVVYSVTLDKDHVLKEKGYIDNHVHNLNCILITPEVIDIIKEFKKDFVFNFNQNSEEETVVQLILNLKNKNNNINFNEVIQNLTEEEVKFVLKTLIEQKTNGNVSKLINFLS